MKNPLKLILAISGALALVHGNAAAGTIRFDFQGSGNSAHSGPGVLGDGNYWNHIINKIAPQHHQEDDQGVLTDVELQFKRMDGKAQSATIQDVRDTWVYEGPNVQPMVLVELSGLRPMEPYKVVLHTPYYGTGQTGCANGYYASVTGRSGAAFPGIEGQDYCVIETTSYSDGTMLIFYVSSESSNYAGFAGLEVQGWLKGEPHPWKADAHLSKVAGLGYKGDDIYSLISVPSQRQTCSTTGPKVKFFARVQNDGNTFGNFRLTGPGTNNKAKRIYRDLGNGGANITAAVITGQFLPSLTPGEHRTVKLVVKPKKKKKKYTLNDRIQVKPERAPLITHGDLVTARTKKK